MTSILLCSSGSIPSTAGAGYPAHGRWQNLNAPDLQPVRVSPRRDIIQTGVINVGNKQRCFARWPMLRIAAICQSATFLLPPFRALYLSPPDELPARRRAGLGNVFAQHQYRIVRFDLRRAGV